MPAGAEGFGGCPTRGCRGTVLESRCPKCEGPAYSCSGCDAVRYHCRPECGLYDAGRAGWGHWVGGEFEPFPGKPEAPSIRQQRMLTFRRCSYCNDKFTSPIIAPEYVDIACGRCACILRKNIDEFGFGRHVQCVCGHTLSEHEDADVDDVESPKPCCMLDCDCTNLREKDEDKEEEDDCAVWV